jgi:glutamine amidotransferase
MPARVAIIDYGAGNLRSVVQAMLHLGAEVQIVDDSNLLHGFSHMLLPGVGSFRKAMSLMEDRCFDHALRRRVSEGVPLLGICLGMQLLTSRSSEDGETPGLGLIHGEVDRFGFNPHTTGLKIPNVGFSTVTPTSDSRLFIGLGSEVDFYFTHSYRLLCQDHDPVAAMSWHGEPYVAAVEQGLIAGTQFHPEKSQANGLRLLSNFLEYF